MVELGFCVFEGESSGTVDGVADDVEVVDGDVVGMGADIGVFGVPGVCGC